MASPRAGPAQRGEENAASTDRKAAESEPKPKKKGWFPGIRSLFSKTGADPRRGLPRAGMHGKHLLEHPSIGPEKADEADATSSADAPAPSGDEPQPNGSTRGKAAATAAPKGLDGSDDEQHSQPSTQGSGKGEGVSSRPCTWVVSAIGGLGALPVLSGPLRARSKPGDEVCCTAYWAVQRL